MLKSEYIDRSETIGEQQQYNQIKKCLKGRTLIGASIYFAI